MISIIYGELNKLARLEYQSKINRRYDRNIYIYSIPVFLMFAPPRSTEGGNSRNLKLIKITKCCKNHRPVPADLDCRIEPSRTRHPISQSSQPHFLVRFQWRAVWSLFPSAQLSTELWQKHIWEGGYLAVCLSVSVSLSLSTLYINYIQYRYQIDWNLLVLSGISSSLVLDWKLDVEIIFKLFR